MIDFSKIESYKENNRIEAKKALGGLPQSIWETYSAFANTLGGVILLGVEEYRDKTLHVVNLPNPERMVDEFWTLVNNKKKVNVNILSENDVTIENINGNRIIAIRVPRAQRYDKPVYIDSNPITGSYRRNGEGDYKCTIEEVYSMKRDAYKKTQDMELLEKIDIDAINFDSVKLYRQCLKESSQTEGLDALSDTALLEKLDAISTDDDGEYHPTIAGLLMFGYESEIIKEFPNFFLDYQEQKSDDSKCSDRIVSASGDWSGNIFEFFIRVYEKLTKDIEIERKDDETLKIPPVFIALREALANCLINADYYGKYGVVIIKKKDLIVLSNPGGFRIDIETAKNGGVSDPRNGALIKMFNLIDIVEHSGSGIPNILRVWKKQNWSTPIITETFKPERITLSLPIGKYIRKKNLKRPSTKKSSLAIIKMAIIIQYITEHISASVKEIAEYVDLKPSTTRLYLKKMLEEGYIVADGNKRNRIYKLKA